MNDTTRAKHRKSSQQQTYLLLGACVVALVITFFDLVAACSRKAGGLAYPPDAFPAMGAVLVAASVAYVLIWMAVAAFTPRADASARAHVVLGIATSLTVLFAAGSLLNVIPPSAFPEKLNAGDYLLRVGLALAAAILAFPGGYFTALHLSTGNRLGRWVVGLTLAMPLLLLELVVVLWLQVYRITPTTSPLTLLSAAMGGVTMLVTLILFVRLQNRGVTRTIVWSLFILTALSPVVRGVSQQEIRQPYAGGAIPDGAPPRVLLICVDTLRADALSCYGNKDYETPHIDALAADSLLFENAISPAPWTLPSMASMLTGLSPIVHRAIDFGAKLPVNPPALAERLRDAGFYTGAIGENYNLILGSGFEQGFHEYDIFPKGIYSTEHAGGWLLGQLLPSRWHTKTNAALLTNKTLRWLERHNERPTFLWLHYFDPHVPYEPPEMFAPEGTPHPAVGNAFTNEEFLLSQRGLLARSAEERDWIRQLYAAEVKHVDASIGRIMEFLRTTDTYRDTLIVLTSDHGEELWEHNNVGHGQSLYHELLHVPLIVKLPDSTHKGRIDSTVSLESIVPTTLDVCGIEYAQGDFSAESLKPLWGGEDRDRADRPILSTGNVQFEHRRSLTVGDLKYIRGLVTQREELFDLSEDPQEQYSIAIEEPQKTQDLRDRLQMLREKAVELRTKQGLGHQDSQKPLDAGTVEALKGLGYL